MQYLRITITILLLLVVVWGAFYTWVLQAVTGLVSESNTGFIALLPQEAKWIITLIFFSILWGLAYAFLRQ